MEDTNVGHASLECMEQAATTAAFECVEEETSYEYATTASANALELLQDNGSAHHRKRQKKPQLQCPKVQWDHIQSVRSKIDNGMCDQFFVDWTRIVPEKQ